MTVVLNGERRDLPAGTSVDTVLAALGARPTGVAVAVNGEVVRRGNWSSYSLADGDRVEVLTAVQGG